MTAVAFASSPAVDAAFTSSPLAAATNTTTNANDLSTTAPGGTSSQARLLLRLPQRPETNGRRHPLKRKWRNIVNFFALPIRDYYLEPPGLAYRSGLRARRSNPWDQGDDQHSSWPCPVYTDQVGDDEMVLFKAQEEAEALAAMQRGQQAATAALAAAQVDTESRDALTDEEQDGRDSQGAGRLDGSNNWPQISPEPASVSTLQTYAAVPSPRYETSDPLSAVPSASLSATQPMSIPLPPRMHIRTRTSSNLASPEQPFFNNGTAMSRHLSTPLTPTVFSSSPPTPILSSSLFSRRDRAQTNAARPTLAGRNISEPLSWTLVRSQYSYPKRGLTAEQLTFLSSVESLGRFGVAAASPDVAPSPAYESAPRAGLSDYGFPTVPVGAGSTQQR